MKQFVLKLNNVHYDIFSKQAFEFNLSATCTQINKCNKTVLKDIAELQVISYMIATGKNFLNDHTSILNYLNTYTLSNFINVINIIETNVTATPIEIEKTENFVKITRVKN